MNRWLCSLLLLGLFPVAASAQTVSVVPSATTYVATGGTASFTVTLTYPGVVTALGFQFGSVPAGWSFVSAGGNNPPGIVPAAGTPGAFEFAYTSIPASPITFTITAAYPAGLVGNQIFSSVIGTLRPGPVTVNGANVVLSPSTAVGAPAITRQPVGAVLTQGDNYLLTVEASGAAPLTYQWRKDGVPISGANNSRTFSLASPQPASPGAYTVVVTNAIGSVTSHPGVVTVEATPPLITYSSGGEVLSIGDYLRLDLLLNVETATVQWRKDGVLIPGATGSSWVVPSVSAASAGAYVATVTAAGSPPVTSRPIPVEILDLGVAPRILRHPGSQTRAPGTRANFVVTAEGERPFTYQWSKDGVAILGATAAAFAIAAATCWSIWITVCLNPRCTVLIVAGQYVCRHDCCLHFWVKRAHDCRCHSRSHRHAEECSGDLVAGRQTEADV